MLSLSAQTVPAKRTTLIWLFGSRGIKYGSKLVRKKIFSSCDFSHSLRSCKKRHIVSKCTIFQHVHEKGPFPTQKGEWKIELFERLARLPAAAGGRKFSLPLWRLDIPIHFLCKKRSYSCTYLKKYIMCNKRAIDFFRLGWWFEHSCITRAYNHHPRKNLLYFLVAQCTDM